MLIVRRFIFTFLASMVPAVEVKGAIPFGVALGLDVKLAYVAALLGSGVVVCFLAFITNWFYRFCKERGYLKRFIILSVFCGNMVSGLILALLSSGVVNLMETI